MSDINKRARRNNPRWQRMTKEKAHKNAKIKKFAFKGDPSYVNILKSR